MKKLANLKGVKALNRREQKSISGGEPPCFEWCACPDIQDMYPNMSCNCSSGSGNSGGNGDNGSGEPV